MTKPAPVPPPVSLVVDGVRRHGRFAARPHLVDPLAEASRLPATLRRLRLKEWLFVTVLHPEWAASLVVQDAHYLASSEVYAARRDGSVLVEHAATARGGSIGVPKALEGGFELRRSGYLVGWELSAEEYRVVVETAASRRMPGIRGELRLDVAAASAPLVVSAPLPGGAMFTHKRVLPVAGELEVGGERIALRPDRDLAILDEHRSFLPYRTDWLWATFAARTDAGLVGANAVQRRTVPGAEDESCLWHPGGVDPVEDVTITPGTGRDGAWEIRSADGRLEVVFTPEGRKTTRHQLGVVAVDYLQLFGRFDGTVTTADGTEAVFDAHGVCERMHARL